MTIEEKNNLLHILKIRFESNINRHKTINWGEVENRLMENDEKLLSLYQMELTGGEPDVIGKDLITNEFIFCDCSKETPIGRRSVCYDHEALEKRINNPPQTSATTMAKTMGIQILTEEQYRRLQYLGDFDLKTSSWLLTPPEIRELGGAIFGDCRYGRVFVYHNGADSYYSSRGFRGWLGV